MSNTKEIKVNINSSSTHRGPEKSTTLNRRYVKRPTKILIEDSKDEIVENIPEPVEEIKEEAPKVEYRKISHINIEKAEEVEEEDVAPVETVEIPKEETPDLPPAPNPYQEALDKKKAERDRQLVAEISSKALKEAAIEKALAEMKSEEEAKEATKEAEKVAKKEKKAKKEEKIVENVMKKEIEAGITGKKSKKASKKEEKVAKHIKKGRAGRIVLAFATSAACMIALAMLVKVNLPNISISVAAAQTGVEASYPSYTPRDFALSGVYTDDKSVVIEFAGPNDTGFSLMEEKTSWDANALVANYVKGAFGSDYETATESGITVYISHSNAAWIKNNILYKLNASSGTLTKRQIKNIVTSL